MSWKLEQNGYIKTWAQDARNSYKIKLKYVVIPKGVKNEVKFIDTPYRFQSYQEAREYAKELFPCNAYTIEGSRDEPNFNETQFVKRTSREELYKVKHYDLYGVKPSYVSLSNSSKYKSIELQQKLRDIDYLRKKLDEKETEIRSLTGKNIE